MTTMPRTLAGMMCAALAIGSLTAVAVAQPLTADRAVEIALTHNSQIVTSAADVLDARSGVYGAASGLLPRVTASLSRSGSFTDNQGLRAGEVRFVGGKLVSGPGTIDVESYSTSPTISGSWSILDLSAISSFSSARQGVKAANLRRLATRHDVVLETRRRFYDVVKAIHLSNVASGALRVARDDERRVRALFEVGSVSKSDLLKAQVRTAQSEFDSLSSSQSVTVTRVNLAQQIGIAEAEIGNVDTVLTAEPRSYDEAALLEEASRNRPDLRAAEAEWRAANGAVTATRLARLPYVTVSGDVTFNPKSSQSATIAGFDSAGAPSVATSGSLSESDREWRGAVALNLDIFDGFGKDSRAASARARQIRLRESRDALRRNLASEVHATLLGYQEAIERDRVARRAVESATENLNLTQQKYNVGSATILELIDAEVQLQRARSDAVSALAAMRVAEAFIERVRGSGN